MGQGTEAGLGMIRDQRESRVTDVAGAKMSVEEMFTLSHGIKVQINILKPRVSKLYIAHPRPLLSSYPVYSWVC